MDYDRKSTVSSFYGGRRGSFDALNHSQSPDYAPSGRPRDDASSFYADRQPRASHEMLTGGQSAGYNASSFFAAGRLEPLKGGRDEEEEAPEAQTWDVYADFNNAGPRYSTAFGIGQHQDAGYAHGKAKCPTQTNRYAAIISFLPLPLRLVPRQMVMPTVLTLQSS
jgi:hypothetical protein